MTDTGRSINRRDALTWLATVACAPALRAVSPPIGSQRVPFSHAPTSQGRAFDDIDTYLARLEGFGFSGALLVARDGDILVDRQHGFSDQASRRRWDADTIFDVGSCTKQFTAAAVLALQADGKLAISDSIARHLPGVPDEKAGITIHHLLTHTAGIQSEFGGDYEVVGRDSFVTRAMAAPLLHAPGARHAYSNAGYSVLAALVERVSAVSFDRFLRERLFRRAGMTASGYELSPGDHGRVARGYRDGEDMQLLERADATKGEMWNLIGNGGLYSTIADLHRWLRALQDDTVLPASSRWVLFAPHALVSSSATGTVHYGYGWYVRKEPSGKTLIWHLGGNGITNTALRLHVDERMWIAYASNVSEFHDPRYPVPAVERMLAGSSVTLPPEVVSFTPEQLARHAGTYRAPTGATLTLAVRRTFLEASAEGQDALAFIADDEWGATPELGALNSRTAEVVEASRLRRFDVVGRLFGSGVTPEALSAFETAFWQKRHARLGEYVGTRVLGTMRPISRRYLGRTIVAIDFRRGTAWREYLWTADGKVGDVGPIEAPPTRRFFPVSTTCFVAFDPAEARSTRMCVEADDRAGILRLHPSGALLRRVR